MWISLYWPTKDYLDWGKTTFVGHGCSSGVMLSDILTSDVLNSPFYWFKMLFRMLLWIVSSKIHTELLWFFRFATCKMSSAFWIEVSGVIVHWDFSYIYLKMRWCHWWGTFCSIVFAKRTIQLNFLRTFTNVTILDHFWSFLATNLLTKVAQRGYFGGYFEKYHFMLKLVWHLFGQLW